MKVAKSKPEQIRINHVDTSIVTLGTFVPFETDDKIESKPVIIINNNDKVWFEIVEDKDYIFKVHGKSYLIDGYPIETDTMLSLNGFTILFGDNPKAYMPMPLDNTPINRSKINAETLLNDIQAFLRQYVGFYTIDMKKDNGMYDLMSHWILYTHIYDVWNTCSYIKLMGDYDSGKSTTSKAIKLLSFSASSAEAKISSPALYRSLHTVGGVTLLDELSLSKAYMDEFRNILKSGIQRDATHKVVNERDFTKIDAFRTYCPKVVAGTDCENIGPVLSSRMIEVVMQKNPPKETIGRNDIYSDVAKESGTELRDRLYMFRLFHAHEILKRKKRMDKSKFFDDNMLSNRSYDIFQPLFTISSLWKGKQITKTLEQAANDQMEMRRVEIYNQLDVPILQVLYQQLHSMKDGSFIWRTDKEISNEIIDIESASRHLYDRKTLTDRYSPEHVGTRIRGMGITKEHKESELGLQWKYTKGTVFKIINQKGLDFSWIAMSYGEQRDAVLNAMELLERSKPLGSYALDITDVVGFNCQTLLKTMEEKGKVKFENGKWLLIR